MRWPTIASRCSLYTAEANKASGTIYIYIHINISAIEGRTEVITAKHHSHTKAIGRWLWPAATAVIYNRYTNVRFFVGEWQLHIYNCYRIITASLHFRNDNDKTAV